MVTGVAKCCVSDRSVCSVSGLLKPASRVVISLSCLPNHTADNMQCPIYHRLRHYHCLLLDSWPRNCWPTPVMTRTPPHPNTMFHKLNQEVRVCSKIYCGDQEQCDPGLSYQRLQQHCIHVELYHEIKLEKIIYKHVSNEMYNVLFAMAAILLEPVIV